jgi:hypothetical protein
MVKKNGFLPALANEEYKPTVTCHRSNRRILYTFLLVYRLQRLIIPVELYNSKIELLKITDGVDGEDDTFGVFS